MSEKYTNRGSTVYENDEELSTIDVVDLLNEQQATISALKEENEKLIQNKCIPCELVSLQVREIDKLKEENEQLKKETVFLAYWKRKAMILLMQVRRLTPRMTDEEVIEFSKELEDE